MATRSTSTAGEARSAKLFGSFSSIMGSHEELGATLQRLAELCAALEVGVPPRVSPERLIPTLRAELREHFATEEADGYFGAITRERPSLVHSVDALKHEHEKILKEAEELARLAADHRRWSSLPRPSLALMGHLRAHEHAETGLLQEFFLQDEGAGAD
jgi:hypothetical protein